MDKWYPCVAVCLAISISMVGCARVEDSGAQPVPKHSAATTVPTRFAQEYVLIINTDSKKIHVSATCPAVRQISPQNYAERRGDQWEILRQEGYTNCKTCDKKYEK